MKRAGLDGDLAVMADAGMRSCPESGGVFNGAVRALIMGLGMVNAGAAVSRVP